MDLLLDAENNYSDALALINTDFTESLGGAMSNTQPMTVEEGQAQFGQLEHHMNQIEGQVGRMISSLDGLKDMMGRLTIKEPSKSRLVMRSHCLSSLTNFYVYYSPPDSYALYP